VFASNLKKKPLHVFDEELFFKMLVSPSVKLKKVAVSQFLMSHGKYSGSIIPSIYPIDKREGYKIIEDHSTSVGENYFKKEVERKIKRYPKKITKVQFFVSSFPVNLDLTSKFTTRLLESMLNIEDRIILSDMRFLIREIWKRDLIYIWFYTLFNWIAIFCFMIHVIWSPNELWLVLVSNLFSAILFTLEMMVASKDLPYYLTNLYSYFDFYQYISMPIIMYLNYNGNLDHSEKYTNAILVLTILISSIRSVSLLRVIDGVRYLIDMIFQVFSDMKYFGIVLASSVVMFACTEI
jgi:hypothetical protein